ncbi:MAG: penicillin-binding protein 2 [Planctomycetes bacterium]|nr:penicillin-binding protein 2 [Planctomycetota bacterium]MCP4772143.1 penicillin-binding protein 2 [Planctomycetota bacterium]MCP4861396.1 penicillin-binding protein 2 [Planctomycetota bacterium]
MSPADMISAQDALDKATATITIPAQSGAILDRNGLVLAEDRCVWNLVINYYPDDRSLVHGVGELNLTAKDVEEKVLLLANACGLEFDVMWRAMMVSPMTNQILREGLTPSERSVIRAVMKQVPYSGLSLQQEFERVYPNGPVLSHLIGLRGDPGDSERGIDPEADTGFEAGLKAYLQGKPGKRRSIRVTGKHGVNPALDMREAEAGSNIRTSVDLKLSEYAREQLILLMEEHNPWRTFTIVVDVKTGQVLSIVGLPDYDPSDVHGSMEKRLDPETEEITFDGWTNPARWNFEPGSTMKPLVAAMALERGDIKENQWFDDHNGSFLPPNSKRSHAIGNARGVPRKPMRAFEGIVYSSNIVFAQVARAIGREGMADMLDFYGYAEEQFRIHGLSQTFEPRRAQPREAFFKERSPDGMAYVIPRMGYGHAFDVPSIQHAMAMAAIANGGTLLDPTFNPESKGENPREILSESTTSYVKEAMLWMVNKGNRTWLPHREDFAYCGKSGTAKINAGAFKDKYTSSFVCYGPYEDPEVLVMVVSYGTSKGGDYGANHFGSKVSGPAAANILHRALELRGSLPSNGNRGLDWAACQANLDR